MGYVSFAERTERGLGRMETHHDHGVDRAAVDMMDAGTGLALLDVRVPGLEGPVGGEDGEEGGGGRVDDGDGLGGGGVSHNTGHHGHGSEGKVGEDHLE